VGIGGVLIPMPKFQVVFAKLSTNDGFGIIIYIIKDFHSFHPFQCPTFLWNTHLFEIGSGRAVMIDANYFQVHNVQR
jgi:hypothetical protein